MAANGLQWDNQVLGGTAAAVVVHCVFPGAWAGGRVKLI